MFFGRHHMNKQDIKARLSNANLWIESAFVGGDWISEADCTFNVVNPATAEVIATLPDTGVAVADKAIDVANQSQKEWAKLTAKERCDIVYRCYQLTVDHADDLAVILTAEMGKPFLEAKQEILYGASFLKWFSEEGKRVYGDLIPSTQPSQKIMVWKQPVGVVAGITPWNFPNAMIARKVAPALVSGCAFVCKPASQTPLSALAMAKLAEQAGLPAGVLSILPSTQDVALGQIFCQSPFVSKLTFTGSTAVGRLLMRQSADRVLKISLELGGNAPFIVFDEAQLDAAVAGAVIAKYRNAGQTCVCANRIYVQAGIYEKFIHRFIEQVSALKVGNGFDSGVSLGPLINEQAVLKVESHVADALSKGANLLCGGKRHVLGGTFFEPTVVSDSKNNMLVSQEETFGPLAPIFKFNSTEEVIHLANNTEAGLAAYFYSRDLKKIWQVAESLDYGIVGVNTGLISTEVAPFGGVKQSGLGREGSKYGLDDYLKIKYVCLGGM